MKKYVKFYMVPSSPWVYLSMRRLRDLSNKYKFTIKLMPIDIFSIFNKNDIKFSMQRSLPIQKNRLSELKRWKKYLKIKLNHSPKFWPVDYTNANKIIVASNLIEDINLTYKLAEKISEAVWRKNLNIADKKTLFQLANDIGIDSKIKHVFNEEKVENILKKYTEDAEVDNVFGVPTFIYRKKLFWGQDRLFFLEKELF